MYTLFSLEKKKTKQCEEPLVLSYNLEAISLCEYLIFIYSHNCSDKVFEEDVWVLSIILSLIYWEQLSVYFISFYTGLSIYQR